MIVYAETNFILEMAFLQEEYESCGVILEYAETGKIDLVVPVFSIGESYEVWVRRYKRRSDLRRRLSDELNEIARSALYGEIRSEPGGLTSILVRSAEEDKRRLDDVITNVLEVATVISLESDIFESAIHHQRVLSPQDSIVYASVLRHLESSAAGAKCFLNRNASDFVTLQDELMSYDCRLIPNFVNGLGFINANLT